MESTRRSHFSGTEPDYGPSREHIRKHNTPTHIARDSRAIYFGSPPDDLLIQSGVRIGLSRDRRAPTELDDDQQEEVKRKIDSTYQRSHRERLDMAISKLHDSVDTFEKARRRSGEAATEVLALPTVAFEIRERAVISSMIFKPIENDKARVKFSRTLARTRTALR
ncbi:hypothetical protein DL762_005362 [Monosporascus cannonballus]|uniref:Up-regulated during septation protein 1 domain-containing protein n=1 Tax=Monosporascus cannonballus TaxID=155416 RepID=A0ABY0H670_9PEZI|nr:hypothetical protein DL762_005362 [Monosporascus cannonballus]RYO87756.1 hypothetical protein DL763_006227 [Monosporascus cannonballus]